MPLLSVLLFLSRRCRHSTEVPQSKRNGHVRRAGDCIVLGRLLLTALHQRSESVR